MVIKAANQRCRVRIKGTDGGYHDCRRGKPGHEGRHGNPVYGDFQEGCPVVRQFAGGQPGTGNYQEIGVIDDKGKVHLYTLE